MEVYAKHCYARSSAQKLRLVANLIRGKKASLAVNILIFTRKKAAFLIKKVLISAISNAKHNNGIDINDLIISKVYIDGASSIKRIMPRAKGKTDRILKRTSHITIFVSNNK